jgi:putative membrane protein
MNTLKTYDAGEELILRDYLALDRTKLANERTLLAYMRMSIGLVAAGAGMVGILDILWANVVGYCLLALTPAAMITGLRRFLKVKKALARLDKPAPGGESA